MTMKEIKFRLWCKDLEEIIEVNKVGFENNKLWYIECIDHDKELLYFSEKDDHVLMQYTGLKDKKGKEIYEGDILKIIDSESSNLASVTFDDGCFCIIGYLGDLRTYPIRNYLFRGYNCEVIGNIYENPELLEGAK